MPAGTIAVDEVILIVCSVIGIVVATWAMIAALRDFFNAENHDGLRQVVTETYVPKQAMFVLAQVILAYRAVVLLYLPPAVTNGWQLGIRWTLPLVSLSIAIANLLYMHMRRRIGLNKY